MSRVHSTALNRLAVTLRGSHRFTAAAPHAVRRLRCCNVGTSPWKNSQPHGDDCTAFVLGCQVCCIQSGFQRENNLEGDEEEDLTVELLAPEDGPSVVDTRRRAAREAVLGGHMPTEVSRVATVDVFSRARVMNFLKRHSKHSTQAEGGKVDVFETVAVGQHEERFHSRLWLPLSVPASLVSATVSATGTGGMACDARVEGSSHGLWAHGIAADRKQAEHLAAMHAEYIIDALGYHIYTLPSMQRKHASAARKAGRYAPVPEGDTLNDKDTPVLPLPLELVSQSDESEGGAWQLVDIDESGRYAALSPPHTLLSPAVFDSASQRRLEAFMESVGHSFVQNCVVQRESPSLSGSAHAQSVPSQVFFTAEIRVPVEAVKAPAHGADEPVAETTPLVAKGRALKKEDAIVLASMHAELLLDALHIPLFPDQPRRQKAHAQAAWSFGRPAPLPGATPLDATRSLLPTALKQLVLGESPRVSLRSADEELVHRHHILTEQTTAFTDTSVAEEASVAQLKAFLTTHRDPRAGDPFFRETILGKIKSSVVLPLSGAYGICGGVGVAHTAQDADILAAMHALDTLCFLGVVVQDSSPDQDRHWKQARASLLGTASANSAATAPGATAAARPPGRRLAPGGFVKRVRVPVFPEDSPDSTKTAARPRRVAKRATTAPSTAEAKVGTDTPGESDSFPKLTADTEDGFLLVSAVAAALPTNEKVPPTSLAIPSPRHLDPLAKERVSEYLATMGRRFHDVFTTRQQHGTATGLVLYECAGPMPVPLTFGDRLALGVAPSRTNAELLAAMHAELLLDALGVCLFNDSVKQRAHSDACRRAGRWAPRDANDGPGPASTPSPPPLRLAHQETPKESPQFDPDTAQDAVEADVLATPSPTANKAESLGGGDQDSCSLSASITEEGLDPVAKTRLQYYLLRLQQPLPTVTFQLSLARGVLLHTASWQLPLGAPAEGTSAVETVRVSGTAPTKRDADVLSWMHAERVLHALGIPLFANLPRYQAWHSRRLSALGHVPCDSAAPASTTASRVPPLRLVSSMTPATLAVPTAPVLREHSVTAARETRPAWEAYVKASDVYVHQKALAEANLFFDAERVPRTGQTLVDATLSEVELRPLDTHAKLTLQLYCNAATVEYPHHWHTATVGPLDHRVCYATIPVPGFPSVTAHGVGANREVAERRAAMHAYALLPFLDPDFPERDVVVQEVKREVLSSAAADGDLQAALASSQTDILASLHQEAAALRIGGASARGSTARRKSRGLKHFMRQSGDYEEGTSEVSVSARKRHIVELYTLCAGLPPPQVTHLVAVDTPAANERATPLSTVPQPRYSTVVSVLHEAQTESPQLQQLGVQAVRRLKDTWRGQASGKGPRENEHVAFGRLYDTLKKEVPMVEELTLLFEKHPFLVPAHLPCLQLSDAQTDAIAKLAVRRQTVAEHAATQAAHPTVDTTADGNQASEVDETAALQDALEMARAQHELESAALQEQYLQKIMNPLYASRFAAQRDRLSIAAHREEILRLIDVNRVVVICGTTGCGKTTQVPQYILDSLTERGEGGDCSIVVTQPRRISAMSIAARVAAERLESVGENCGYVIRFDANVGRHINFCTTGVLMRMLSSSPDLDGIKYLVVDEIHERDLTSDFLLIVLRDIIQRRPDLRVILMSATLQAAQFGTYFRGAPIINVEGYAHPVQELYLEDIAALLERDGTATPLAREALRAHQREKARRQLLADEHDGYDDTAVGDGGAAGWSSDTSFSALGTARQTYAAVEATSEIDYVIVQCAIEQGIRMVDKIEQSSVLVFLPGWEEIEKAKEILERDARYQIIPLHSSVSPSDQMRCFLPAEEGKIKVVLATNIAESGITIDDVAVVVDLGRVKEKTYVQLNHDGSDRERQASYVQSAAPNAVTTGSEAMASRLLTVFASRANCIQRRGRAGRTRPGVCIRLFSRAHYAGLHEFQTPEIQRTPLDALCLHVLALGLPDPVVFLAGAMDPPAAGAVESAMHRLVTLGAVTESRALSALGTRLAQLPLEPRLGKLVLLGAAFRCLDTALTIASAAQTDVFKPGRENRTAVRLHREDLSGDALSDDIAALNAYNYWVRAHYSGSPADVAAQLGARLLSVSQLVTVSRQKHQFLTILRKTGLLDPRAVRETRALDAFGTHATMFVDTSRYSARSQCLPLVKSVLAGAFTPCVALYTGGKTFRTKHRHSVFASQDSVLAKTPAEAVVEPFFVYHEAFQVAESRRTAVQGLSSVSVWALVLFAASNVRIARDATTGLVTLDDWVVLHTSHRTFKSLMSLRDTLSAALNTFYEDPHNSVNSDLVEELWKVISGLVTDPLVPNRLSEKTWHNMGVILSPTPVATDGDTENPAVTSTT